MASSEPYRVLGLDVDADGDDLKAAYRFLSKKYHPDRTGNPATGVRFAKVVKAYRFLDLKARSGKARAGFSPACGETTRDDDVFSLGAKVLSSPDPAERRLAARRLGFTGRVAAYVFLRRALSDKDEGVVAASVRSIADLSLFQASGEIAALWARSGAAVKASILEAAEATGEGLFLQTLRLAASDGGLEGLRARRLLSENGTARGA